MRLVLFDIDGTLISDRGAAREAFADALVEVYGYQGDLSRFDFSGLTDPQIARMVLLEADFDENAIERHLPRLWERYLARLQQNATAGRVEVLPGIRPLLDTLAVDTRAVLGLLTGNLERGARIKLAPPQLNEYFSFGAYGSDSADRTQLPPLAAQRASRHAGVPFAASDIVIIGDSIYDVRCGVPHGATTIAIASGKTSAEALRAENPDHFFTSAEDLEGLLPAILGQK